MSRFMQGPWTWAIANDVTVNLADLKAAPHNSLRPSP